MTESSPSLSFPSSRAGALAALSDFLPSAVAYAERRNYVEPGHANVSRLSPVTRTRLLLEREIGAAARARHGAGAVAKFEDEVWWRLYWKGWLELRPSVWRQYREELEALTQGPNERASAVAAGESGVAIMDHFARELVGTGYLHNHARMWWASYWIHVERLPWQLGADFFLRHLLDGDAASNTLSWRWVAGLHTQGKSYLVRRSNLERYVDADLLKNYREGLSILENTFAVELPFDSMPRPVFLEEDTFLLEPLAGRPWGLWLHDEDLLPEISPLSALRPAAVAAIVPLDLWETVRYSEQKRSYYRSALADGASRAGEFFQCPSGLIEADVLTQGITEWAADGGFEYVVALRPSTGPLADRVPAITEALTERGIRLVLVRRPDDVAAMNVATAGFFKFREKTAPLREVVGPEEGRK